MSRWLRLRPLVFCLCFLILLDVGVRVWVQRTPPYPWDGRFREGNIYPYEVAGALAALGQAQGSFNIVLIGDSVLRGAHLYDWETARGVLEYHFRQDYPDRNIRVWNFALAGSRGADKYAMLRLVAPYKPDLVVMNIDYKFFNSPKLSYQFLADAFQDDPDVYRFNAAIGLDPFEEIVQHRVKNLWALYRYREWINYHIFGDAPYNLVGEWVEDPKVDRHANEWVDPRKPWYEKNLQITDHLRNLYATEPITPDNGNYMAWERIANFIEQEKIPAFIYWTPQNHRFLGPLIDTPGYEHNRQVVAKLFAGRNLTYKDYDRAMDDLDLTQGAFIDGDHLTPVGSKRFADRLYQDIRPLVEQRLMEVQP
jgi:lysophospholipase L1-like esterase